MDKVQVRKGERVRLFNSICIESAAMCNRSCVFCPNHTYPRPDEYMPLALLEKMADELGALNYAGRITSYIYNEPMRDRRLLDIIKLFTDKAPRASFMISTNGDYLRSEKDLQAVYDAGARMVLVNIYSKADAAKDNATFEKGVAVAQRRYEQVLEWANDIEVEFSSKVYGTAPRNARRFHIERKFGVRADNARLGAIYELQNRSGNIEWMQPALTEPLEKMCVRPWRVFNINWRGEAILCCNDFHGATNFGNVKDKTLVELWNSKGMNKYRLFLQNKRRDIALCDKCDFKGGAYTHAVQPVTFGKNKDNVFLHG